MVNGIVRTIYLAPELASEYENLARDNERSFSAQVRRALKEYKGDGRVIVRQSKRQTTKGNVINR